MYRNELDQKQRLLTILKLEAHMRCKMPSTASLQSARGLTFSPPVSKRRVDSSGGGGGGAGVGGGDGACEGCGG